MKKIQKMLSTLVAAVLLTTCFYLPAGATNSPSTSTIFTDRFVENSQILCYEDYILLQNNTLTTPTRNIASSKTSTTVFLIPKEDKMEEVYDILRNIQTPTRASGDNSVDDVDGSISIRGYLTIEYDYADFNGYTEYDVTACYGSYDKLDRSVYVDGQQAAIGMFGVGSEGNVTNQNIVQTVSGTSWSLPIPSSWKPVCSNDIGVLNAQYYISMHRGTSSSWGLNIVNTII